MSPPADKYEIVQDGKSPDGHYSIAITDHPPHVTERDGQERYHDVYLMAEPAHRKIGLLEEIERVQDSLDYTASWSADSHHVAVHYTIGGRFSNTALYRIARGRAHPIPLPDLVTFAQKADDSSFAARSFSVKSSDVQLEWLSRLRFRVSESATFYDVPIDQAKQARHFFRILDDTTTDGKCWIGFAATAVCELTTAGRCRVLSLKPEH